MSRNDYPLDCSDDFKGEIHRLAVNWRNKKREQVTDKKIPAEDMWLIEAMEREFKDD